VIIPVHPKWNFYTLYIYQILLRSVTKFWLIYLLFLMCLPSFYSIPEQFISLFGVFAVNFDFVSYTQNIINYSKHRIIYKRTGIDRILRWVFAKFAYDQQATNWFESHSNFIVQNIGLENSGFCSPCRKFSQKNLAKVFHNAKIRHSCMWNVFTLSKGFVDKLVVKRNGINYINCTCYIETWKAFT